MDIFIFVLSSFILLVSIIEYIYVVSQSSSNEQKASHIVAICNLILCAGNFIAVVGNSSDIAYTGLIITYLGGSNLGIGYYLIFTSLVHEPSFQKRQIIPVIVNFIWIIIAFFDDRFHILYKSLTYEKVGCVNIRTVDFNWGFYLYCLWLLLFLIPLMRIILKCAAKKKYLFKYLRKPIIAYLIAGLLTYLGSVYSTVTKSGFDFTALSSTVAEFIVLLVIFKYKIYPLSQNAEEQILDNLEDAIFSYDKENRLIYANVSARKILGIVEDCVCGTPVDYINERVYRALHLGNEEKVILNNRSYYCYVLEVKGKIHDEATIRWLKDVTDEEKFIEEAEYLKNVADNANEAKSTFLANISHEIRTPLNAVIGMDELIIRDSKEENIINYANNIMRSGKALMSLINDVLDYSKIEAGKMEIVDSQYKLTSLLKDIALMTRLRAEKKELLFNINVNENIPLNLIGDSNRIRQILLNILSNSVKYTENGGIDFSITGRKGQEKGYFELKITIRDTGIGIKDEDMNKLFGKFERIENEKNHSTEGTGLGMSIAMSLLELMNGKLMVNSIYGEGTTFEIILPQKMVDDETIGVFDENAADLPDNNNNDFNYNASSACILIVDDVEMNRFIARNLLDGHGIEIDEAESGERAVELTKEKKYDIILLDYRMPGMSGVEALEIIRMKDNPNVNSKIIVMTADSSKEHKDLFMNKGFDDYISKPMEARDYLSVIFRNLPKEKIEY